MESVASNLSVAGSPALEDTESSSSFSPSSGESKGIGPGDLVGRHVILNEVGHGARGIVYEAYDPELDRKSALKLLSSSASASSTRAKARLRREAQALARLTHPNVVTVYDVGTHAGQVFVTMELVRGKNLYEWMSDVTQGRPWREVLSVFIAAGRGLSAVHGEGLVHRDFKPENVMLGDDGRVRVMDFGLARWDNLQATLDDEIEPPTSMAVELTRRGSKLGTPAYMAPEQFRGKTAVPRSDQFAFCVALYEALYGERPYPGASFSALEKAVLEGRRRALPRDSKVPRWVAEALSRGLETNLDARYPSMDALLEVLSKDPHERRRRVIGAGAALAALGLAGWLGSAMTLAPPPDAPCTGLEAELEGVWSPQRRAEVEAQVGSHSAGYAQTTAKLVVHALDDYAQTWLETRVGTCEASHAGLQSDLLFDRKIACLERRREGLGATVDALAQLDEGDLEQAVRAVTSLPAVQSCMNVDMVMADIPLPDEPDERARVIALDAKLARVQVKRELLDFEALGREMSALEDELAANVHLPTKVRASMLEAALIDSQGDYEAAHAKLVEVYELALSNSMMREATLAATQIISILSIRLERHSDAHGWVTHASPLARASKDPRVAADLLRARGQLAESEGKFEPARELLSQAQSAFEEILGPDALALTQVITDLAILEARSGNFDRAQTYFERVLEINIAWLGPRHPQVGSSVANLAHLQMSRGHIAEARPGLTRALEIFDSSLGPGHPDTAITRLGLAEIAAHMGDFDEAISFATEGHAQLAEAIGPESVAAGRALATRAGAYQGKGQLELALADCRAALAIFEPIVGSEAALIGETLSLLGEVLLELGRSEAAIVELERARTNIKNRDGDPQSRARVAYSLAQAVWNSSPRDESERARSLALAQEAHTDCLASAPELAEEVHAWLAKRGAAP